MTDIEMLIACADAAGVKVWAVGERLEIMNGLVSTGRPYDPLTDDGQCFALVKKFGLAIESYANGTWVVFTAGWHEDWSEYVNADLNRAIVEAVAKTQRG